MDLKAEMDGLDDWMSFPLAEAVPRIVTGVALCIPPLVICFVVYDDYFCKFEQ